MLRKEHLVYSGLDEGKATEALAVVWLSYSVNGNESSSMEAAMKPFTLLQTNQYKSNKVVRKGDINY